MAHKANKGDRDKLQVTDALLFHTRCGSSAAVINGQTTACRNNAMTDHKNGVVLTSRELSPGELFEVRLDRKVGKWTGSIEIGVTTCSPDDGAIPSTVKEMGPNTWTLSGCEIIYNGITVEDEYGENLDSLEEGSRVGVIRRLDGTLHFLVNGVDQGVAATDVPAQVYGVIHLYGQAAQATIIRPEDHTNPHGNVQTPLVFHSRCGSNAVINKDGTTAHKPNAKGDHKNGVALTSRVLAPGELFEVLLDRRIDKWWGSIAIGVTTHTPEELDIPSTVTDLRSGTWIVTGREVKCNGTTVAEEYGGEDLDDLKEGDKVGVMRQLNGDLHVFINGVDQGVAATDVPADVYGVIDLYGQAAQVTITDHTAISTPFMADFGISEGLRLARNSIRSEDQGHNMELPQAMGCLEVTGGDPQFYPQSTVSIGATSIRKQGTGTVSCPYWKLCERFVESLNLAEEYFELKYDLCFCGNCNASRGDNRGYYNRGDPPKLYGLPVDWSRFGLGLSAAAKALRAVELWHVAFHGTVPQNIPAILESQSLLMSGDVNIRGTRLAPPPGHFTDEWKPEGFDIRQIFLSPSIKYAGLPVYAKPQRWTDPKTQMSYQVQVAFQARIKPGSYKVGGETAGLKGKRLDDRFDNSELEWSTEVRGATILTGILVKMSQVIT